MLVTLTGYTDVDADAGADTDDGDDEGEDGERRRMDETEEN